MESKKDNNFNYKEIIESRNNFKVEDKSLLIEKALNTESNMVKKEDNLNKKVPELADKGPSIFSKSLNPQKPYIQQVTNIMEYFFVSPLTGRVPFG